ncbi:MAG: alcohol dehydrogenase family protein [Bacteroidota bacterium]
MKAITYQGIRNISTESIPDPEINHQDDVIVKVKVCGLCGSDLHVYRGHEQGLDCGTAMGHEFVGEIVEVGKAVKHFKKGDTVVSPFTTNCGQCYYCKIGLTCRCENGQLYGWVEQDKGLHGGQAEFVNVPLADHTLVKLEDGISEETGLFLGDILSTGYYCADMAAIRPGGTYAVIGCGPVGLMAVVSAFDLGAQEVFAIDSVPERLDTAAAFGATPINYITSDVLAIIMNGTKGRGVEAVMEAVGHPSASRMAVDIVRPGGIISTVGVHTSEQFSFSPVEAYDKNLTYKIGRCPARHYMPILMEKVKTWNHDLTSIISHRLALEEGAEAYRIFDNKEDNCLKVVFTL